MHWPAHSCLRGTGVHSRASGLVSHGGTDNEAREYMKIMLTEASRGGDEMCEAGAEGWELVCGRVGPPETPS
jgi:hypothetical protein